MTDFSASGASGFVGGATFVALLAAAAITDVRARRIPNRLVLVIAVSGLAYTVLTTLSVGAVGRALLAGLLGFALWIPFYALRMIGAGDVKLFAAAGLWLVPLQVLHAALLAALVGGVLSLIGMVAGYGGGLALLRLTHGLRQPETLLSQAGRVEGKTLPYGVAMAVGLIVASWLPRLFGS
jgi:prepilin peptidase CpaA